MSWRELGAYLAHLPLESATQTIRVGAMSDADFDELAAREHHTHGPWSHTDLLLAHVADSVERLIHVQLRKAGVKAEPPPPIPRPGIRTGPRTAAASPAQQAYLQRLRDRQRDLQEGAGT